MKLHLYATNDAVNVINKTLLNEVVIDIYLKRDVNINYPELILSGDFRQYNYAYIPEIGNYYFIQRIEQLNLHNCKAFLQMDVLETHKNIILNSVGNLTRDINEGDNENFNSNIAIKKETYFKSDVEVIKEQSIIISTMEVKK